jgi:hypothetical protein
MKQVPLAAELLLELEVGLVGELAAPEPHADSANINATTKTIIVKNVLFVIFFILAAPGCNLYPTEIFYRKASHKQISS